MKTLTLCTIILTLFVSCSTENEVTTFDNTQNNLTTMVALRKTGSYPENSANIYDDAGQLYYQISDAYLSQGNLSGTTSAIITQVESIANLNLDFFGLLPATYASPTASRIDYILSNQQVTALDIISNSSLSVKGKTSMAGFATSLMLYKNLQKDYDYIYKFIVNYEVSVIDDNTYTPNDKKILLTTSSVSRYEFYFAKNHRRKPRDRDWEISWGHIVAAMDGSEANTAKAIVMSVVTGLIYNN